MAETLMQRWENTCIFMPMVLYMAQYSMRRAWRIALLSMQANQANIETFRLHRLRIHRNYEIIMMTWL